MEKYNKPKPELSNYLKEDLLKSEIDKACKSGDHESVFEMVNSAAKTFEEKLFNWYDRKAIQESPTISEEHKRLVEDLDNLGF
jgi:hypothetical protein